MFVAPAPSPAVWFAGWGAGSVMFRWLTTLPNRLAFVVVVALLLTSCAKPVPYSRGQAIPLGSITVTVSHAESMSAEYVGGVGSRMAKRGEQILVVYFRISRMGVQMERAILPLRSMFSLRDGEGHKYRAVPMAAGFFNQMRASRSMETMSDYYNSESAGALSESFPTEWVLLFAVPETARDFTLLVNNSNRLKDQPRKAAVALGR